MLNKQDRRICLAHGVPGHVAGPLISTRRRANHHQAHGSRAGDNPPNRKAIFTLNGKRESHTGNRGHHTTGGCFCFAGVVHSTRRSPGPQLLYDMAQMLPCRLCCTLTLTLAHWVGSLLAGRTQRPSWRPMVSRHLADCLGRHESLSAILRLGCLAAAGIPAGLEGDRAA